MKKKILILGVASVQMDAINELKELGYETHAIAMAKDGPGADLADYFEEINILDENSIINYIKENKISAVYSIGSDLAIPVASSISEKLDLPLFVTEDTARFCNNKNLMRGKLGNDFFGNVKFQIVENIEDDIKINYPFILKPTDSQGQRGVFLINSFEDYVNNYNKAKEYSRSGLVILEQYISGPELSVNGYIVNGELVFLIPSDRQTWPEYTGLIHKHIVPSVNLAGDISDKMKLIIEKACSKLGINNGPVYTQMKLEQGIPYIIEITPRLDGCHMWKILTYYTGVNLIKLTFQHLLENDVSELNKQYDNYRDSYVLEFICQKPKTAASYTDFENEIRNALYSFNYYNPGDIIRPVNGRFEKIGYFINKV
ncbi:ATP-grasp domain-containing protein [Virgibacillus proomii]|jgi:biotin carboxylase|uniref:ATP-grasp domain-containing protein n=1 Tax=Virgibacillus proomii TaxID=84407 RepID=UPI0009872B35|nr:ATP-grasp domain-containing protein [Virgibacillus proomii]